MGLLENRLMEFHEISTIVFVIAGLAFTILANSMTQCFFVGTIAENVVQPI